MALSCIVSEIKRDHFTGRKSRFFILQFYTATSGKTAENIFAIFFTPEPGAFQVV